MLDIYTIVPDFVAVNSNPELLIASTKFVAALSKNVPVPAIAETNIEF